MTRRQLLAGVPLLTTAVKAAARKVDGWSIITIGNLSRNQYWGEPNDKAFRDVLCTTTLIAADGFRLLVDPSVTSPDGMAKELNRRTGLKLDDITAIFITHEHGDHVAGLANFPKAPWYSSADCRVLTRGNPRLPEADRARRRTPLRLGRGGPPAPATRAGIIACASSATANGLLWLVTPSPRSISGATGAVSTTR